MEFHSSIVNLAFVPFCRIGTAQPSDDTKKKTNEGLSNEKLLQRRVEIFRKFKFLKFRLTGKYFSEIQKDGDSRKQSHERTRETKPLIVAITHDKNLSSGN